MSDAHANPVALAKALADAKRQGCDRYLFLGDMTGYGYDAKATVDAVRRGFDVVLMGNHDSVCVGLDRQASSLANRNYDLDRASRAALTELDVEWIRTREYRHDEGGFACVHGDFIDPADWGYVNYPQDAWFNFLALGERRLAFCGHTHHACVWTMTNGRRLECRVDELGERLPRVAESQTVMMHDGVRYLVNCGSVGYPRRDPWSTYAIYDADGRSVSIRRLPFDFAGYVAAMTERGIALPPWLAARLKSPS